MPQNPPSGQRANEQLKHQYAHKLHDQYYTAIAHSVLQTSDPTETFTQFWGRLPLTFVAAVGQEKLALRQQQLRPLP